jgi:hypothetical protein
MKHIKEFAVAMFFLASFAGAGTVAAQDHSAKATVPFNFNVGNRWVPAGTYIMSSNMGNPRLIFIRSEDGKTSLLSVTQADDRQSDSNKLVFTKYGDQYFLHGIQCPGCGMNVAFPNSKHERIARTRLEAGLSSPTELYLAVSTSPSGLKRK